MPEHALWLTEADVSSLASLEDAIEVLAAVYHPDRQGQARAMPRAHARDGQTILHAVGGVLPADSVAGTKTWIYSPAGASPLVVVFCTKTGALLGIVEAFALGLWRTSATTGLGTRELAREDASVLALLGTGKQALSQARAVAAVRELTAVRIFGRDRGRLERFGVVAAAALTAEVSLHTELRAAVGGADIVTTITRAPDAFFDADLLEPGMHVNAVGAIVPGRSELTGGAVGRCDVVVADSLEQALTDSSELGAAVAAGVLAWEDVRSLTDVLADPAHGRREDPQISLFKAMGMGLSDIALAAELLRRAREHGRGTELPATPDPHSFQPPPHRSSVHA